MGNFFSINMEENFKKNQEFIQTLSKIKMERQLQAQYQMAQRFKAMEIARAREMTNWICMFYATTVVGLVTGFRRTKRSYLLAPLVPLTFYTLYNIDLGYGNKLHRIRAEAEHIMTHEADSLLLPHGLPTLSSIDQARLDAEDQVRLHPHPL